MRLRKVVAIDMRLRKVVGKKRETHFSWICDMFIGSDIGTKFERLAKIMAGVQREVKEIKEKLLKTVERRLMEEV